MIFLLVTILLVAADQITKLLTLSIVKPQGSVEFIKNVINFSYVENRGAAFGILQNSRWIFITLSIVAIAAIIWYLCVKKPSSKILTLSLMLILSGAVGNMIDRLFRGFVVDMIELAFVNYPVFNFADCCVVIGAIFFGIYILFIYKEPVKEEKND